MSKRSIAILYMLISTFSFSIMGAAVKYLDTVPVLDKVLVRNCVSPIVAMIIARKAHKPLFGSSRKGRILLTIRSLFGLCGVGLIFYATTKLSLADSALFMRLSPFWVTILAIIFLKEKIKWIQYPALILAFIGSVAIIRPWESGTIITFLPALAGFVASLCAASAYTLVSKLKAYEDPATIVFFFSFISVVASALIIMILVQFTDREFFFPNAIELAGLAIIGLAAASGQMFLTHAYRIGAASEVSIYNYVGIVFSTLLGFLFWKEIPTAPTIIGAVAILSAGWLVFRFGRARAVVPNRNSNS